MPTPSISIRLGTSGGNEVRNDFANVARSGQDAFNAIGAAGDANARKVTRAYEQAITNAERANERLAAAAAKVQAVSSQTAIQAQIGRSVSTGFGDYDGTARSMSALIALEQQREAKARALRAALDPLAAAQERYNAEVREYDALLASGHIKEDLHAQALMRSRQALEQTSEAHKKGAASASAHRQAMAGLSYQAQDVFTQLSMGANPLQVITVQGMQAAGQMQHLETRAGKVAQFMLGPWGLALSAGALALSAVLPKLLGTNDALDEGVKKLKEDALQTEVNRKAKERYLTTLDGQIARQRELNAELERAVLTQRQMEAAKYNEVSAGVENLRTRRPGVVGDLNRARVAARRANELVSNAALIEPGALKVLLDNAAAAEERVKALESQLKDLDTTIADGEARARSALLPLIERNIAASMDAGAAATERYTIALGELRQEFAKGKISQREFEAQDRRNQQIRDAAIKAEQQANQRDRVTQLLSPVDGRITSGFGHRARPTAGASAFHNGIDFAAPVGTQVRAGADGVVVRTGRNGGLGNVVWIDYGNNVVAEFNHLSEALVKPGDVVRRGQAVALTGNTGVSTGPHLDYRLKVGGAYVDPSKGVNLGKGVGDALGDYDRAAQRRAEEAAAALKRLQGEAATFEERFDPAAAAARSLREELERIAALKDANVISPDVAGAWTKAANDEALRARAARFGEGLLDEISPDLDREQADSAKRDALRRDLEDARGRTELLRYELSLGGMSERQRQRAVDLRAMELDLLREFGPAQREAIDLFLKEAEAQDEIRDRIEMIRTSMDELRGFGEEFASTFLDPDTWSSWGNAGRTALRMLYSEAMKLVLLNPVKNWINGNDSLPTINSVMSLFKKGGRMDGVADVVADLKDPARNAAGTPWFSGGLTWLSENGPELVSLPRGSSITPAAETRRLLSGANDNRGGVTQNFDLRGAVVQEDLYREMSMIGDRAAARGAAGGAQLSAAQSIASSTRRLGRRWG